MTLLYKKTSSIHSQITRPQPAPQNPLRAFKNTVLDKEEGQHIQSTLMKETNAQRQGCHVEACFRRNR